MNTNYALALIKFEFLNRSVVTLTLKTQNSFLACTCDRNGLNVVILPGSYADLGYLVITAKNEFTTDFRPRPNQRRSCSIVKVQFQTVYAYSDTSRNFSQESSLEFSGAK